jgi:hypothetical protein
MTMLEVEYVEQTHQPEVATFTVSTSDRDISPEDNEIVGRVRRYWLARLPRMRVRSVERISASGDESEHALVEAYRDMSDEMLAIAHEARAAQIRALPHE